MKSYLLCSFIISLLLYTCNSAVELDKSSLAIEAPKLKLPSYNEDVKLDPQLNPFSQNGIPELAEGRMGFFDKMLDYSESLEKARLLKNTSIEIEDYSGYNNTLYSGLRVEYSINVYDDTTTSVYTQTLFSSINGLSPFGSDQDEILYLGGKTAVPCKDAETGSFLILDRPATYLCTNDDNSIIAIVSAEQWGDAGWQNYGPTFYFIDRKTCEVKHEFSNIEAGSNTLFFNPHIKTFPYYAETEEVSYHFHPQNSVFYTKKIQKKDASAESRKMFEMIKQNPDKSVNIILTSLGYKAHQL